MNNGTIFQYCVRLQFVVKPRALGFFMLLLLYTEQNKIEKPSIWTIHCEKSTQAMIVTLFTTVCFVFLCFFWGPYSTDESEWRVMEFHYLDFIVK